MDIQNISKEQASVTVKLNADELVLMCNLFYMAQTTKEKKTEKFLQLYSDMMLCRDLCQYGHVDNFCLSEITKCRNSIGKGLNGVLSNEDTNKFNSCLEDIQTVFSDPEWIEIYRKIVGEHELRKKISNQ